MKSKNISSQSGELLYYFNSRNVYCFDSTLAYQAIPNSKPSTVRELLSDMTRRGLLMRIKDGLYHIVPYEKNASLYMPEWHLLVEHLVGDANHYIGYYSALEIHDLITQPSLKEQIVVSKQIRPSEIYVKDIPFQFIFHNDKHFFGGKKIWIDEFDLFGLGKNDHRLSIQARICWWHCRSIESIVFIKGTDQLQCPLGLRHTIQLSSGH